MSGFKRRKVEVYCSQDLSSGSESDSILCPPPRLVASTTRSISSYITPCSRPSIRLTIDKEEDQLVMELDAHVTVNTPEEAFDEEMAYFRPMDDSDSEDEESDIFLGVTPTLFDTDDVTSTSFVPASFDIEDDLDATDISEFVAKRGSDKNKGIPRVDSRVDPDLLADLPVTQNPQPGPGMTWTRWDTDLRVTKFPRFQITEVTELVSRYRCKDCHGPGYMCGDCTVRTHRRSPLHRIDEWNGLHWQSTSLKTLGLVVHLNHDCSESVPICPAPEGSIRTITVMDIGGIHSVNVVFCGCSASSGNAGHAYVQLIRQRWFPASHRLPQTVTTFNCLEDFHLMTVQGKLTGYDYYQTLVRKTDNTGINPPPSRYDEFMKTCRFWRHMKMLKRAGVAHLPGGVASAPLGSCAVECPACPHPEASPRPTNESESWLDSLFVMLDANFRLKCKDRSIDDPALGSGLAYYVEDTSYKKFLSSCGPQIEMNVCDSGLHAVDHANARGNDAYTVSGVGACQCRHMLVRKNGVGDLQKGEKYCNMDFIFWSAVKGHGVPRMVISYDIACQWNRNHFARIAGLPSGLQFHNPSSDDAPIFEYVIPKFHIRAHGQSCQSRYSLNFRPLMARTDGENIERGWSWMNPASLSTREMGLGSRHDTLDDQWASWNWCILTKLGSTLARRFEEALLESRDQRAQHSEFTATFTPANIQKWTQLVDNWNADPLSSPDPYLEPEPNTTINDVRRELNAEEDAEVSRGVLPLHQTSVSQFLATGLELEEQQRSLHALHQERKSINATTRSLNLEEKEISLRRKIVIWQNVQRVYMPGIAATSFDVTPVDADDESGDPDEAPSKSTVASFDIPLNLPSSLENDVRYAACIPGLEDKERRLRFAQAADALVTLRRHLRIACNVLDHKSTHTAGTGTKPNTRMQDLIRRYAGKVHRDAERYRAARKSLLELDPTGNWMRHFYPLRENDVRPPLRTQEFQSEGRRKLSWIWRISREGNDDELEEGLKVEWAKSKARVERWEEEVLLVQEEMRRTLTFMDYKATWWRSLPDRRPDVAPDVASGLKAYAEKQASIRKHLAVDFAVLWREVYSEYSQPLPQTWPSTYLTATSGEKLVRRRPLRMKLRRRALDLFGNHFHFFVDFMLLAPPSFVVSDVRALTLRPPHASP
ncbi:hypothetical protein DFH11DRAFT_1549960 [Phellopilus nigrolimitatus]|nr:hypothetical protein DFH11DRAFT_1549960 [Phellopilus nigrolimitatus]